MNKQIVQRTAIRDLEVDFPNAMLVVLVIGKQEPFHLKIDEGEASRAVWNFTIRDTPRDYINCAYWGTVETVTALNTLIQIGCLVEITNPRVTLRNAEDLGEQYRPTVTSPFQLVINEKYGNVNKVWEDCGSLMSLLKLPTKPIFNYTTLDFVFSNIHTSSGLFFDLLVAVRQIGEMRIVNTRNGLKEVRNVIVFDRTNPGMVITFWNQDYIAKANLWQPRKTILFIADCRVKFDSYSNTPKGSPSSKSIITEDPEGSEARALKEYAITVPLHSSTTMDFFTAIIPDASSIKTVMNVQQIVNKIDQIAEQNSARIEDQQFAAVVYATVTEFDIDGQRKILSIRCATCKNTNLEDEQRCSNPICLSNTTDQPMSIEKVFDIRLQITDMNGSLTRCRLSGKHAENIIKCDAAAFSQMSDDEKAAIKWRFLMEYCELKLVIYLKNKRPFITVLSLDRAAPPENY